MKTRTIITTAALACTLLTAGACSTGTALGLGVSGGLLAGAGVAGAGTGGAVAMTAKHAHFAPRVTIRNQSTDDAALRMWVGKIDITEPMGVTDIRTDTDLAVVIEPGSCAVRRPDKRGWSTARRDAIVWVNLALARPAVEGPNRKTAPSTETVWIAFERPGPFELVIIDTDNGQAIDTDRTSPFTDLPTDRRIVGRLGEHPVWDASPSQIAAPTDSAG